jgi:hypothetical protein
MSEPPTPECPGAGPEICGEEPPPQEPIDSNGDTNGNGNGKGDGDTGSDGNGDDGSNGNGNGDDGDSNGGNGEFFEGGSFFD